MKVWTGSRLGSIIAEWFLKPLLTACFVMIVCWVVLVVFSKEFGLPYRELIWRKLTDQYQHQRKLSPALIADLRSGGFTLFIRHASRDGTSSPSLAAIDRASVLDKTLIPPDFRPGLCLNETGRVESRLLGHFLKSANIPVGEVLASPICRARETAELSVGRINRLDFSLVFENALAGSTERTILNEKLKRLIDQVPPSGANRLLFSHATVLERIGYKELNLGEAGMVILRHTSDGPKVEAIVTLAQMIYALPWAVPSER